MLQRLGIVKEARSIFENFMDDARNIGKQSVYEDLLFFVDYFNEREEVDEQFRERLHIHMPDEPESTGSGGLLDVACNEIGGVLDCRAGAETFQSASQQVSVGQQKGSKYERPRQRTFGRKNASNDGLFHAARAKHNWLALTISFPRLIVRNSDDDTNCSLRISNKYYLEVNRVHIYDVVDYFFALCFN